MALRIENKKWILYRHTNDFNLLIEVAQNNQIVFKYCKERQRTAKSTFTGLRTL